VVVAVLAETWGGPDWHGHWGGPLSIFGLFAFPALLLLCIAGLGVSARVARVLRSHRTRLKSSRVPQTTTAETPVLASDGEREHAAHLVSAAMGEGRLDLDEGAQRLQQVWESRHRHQLSLLTSDLPALRARHRSWAPALAALVALGALVVQLLLGVWVLWPLAVAGFALIAVVGRR
jgi:hypothetical protein